MIGDRLSELRKDAGLTQSELAEILQINKHSVSSYERDKSEPPDIIKTAICDYFNVSSDYLLGICDTPHKFNPKSKYLELPGDFPEKAMENLKDYAEFLQNKYKP